MAADLAIFKVEEGVTHWVDAEDAADALRLTYPADCEWESDPPKVTRIGAEEAEKTPLHNDDGRKPTTMQADYESDPSRHYMGCSEW